MASCSRFGHSISTVLCPSERSWGNNRGPNNWTGDDHRPPGAFPHHNVPRFSVARVFHRLRQRDASGRHHQRRWVDRMREAREADSAKKRAYISCSWPCCWTLQSVALPATCVCLTRPSPRWEWHGGRRQEMSSGTRSLTSLPRAVRGTRCLSMEKQMRLCCRTLTPTPNTSCSSAPSTPRGRAILFSALEQR